MKYNNLKKIMISCGGTGGHFNPGLSIADQFQKQGGSVQLILGGKHAADQSKKSEERGIAYNIVRCAPMSKNPIRAFVFLKELFAGIRQCKRLFREYKPDAVLSMGAYTSAPAAIAAWLTKTPLFLHDGNAKVGKSNRFFTRFATGIALSFPAVNANMLHCPHIVTGLPLRDQLLNDVPIDKQEAIHRLNEMYHTEFEASKPVILVFGGSLGATTINENFALPDDSPEAKEVQIIHLSGPDKLESIRKKYESIGKRALTLESASAMQILYMAADLVICRAGGSTISELALFGRYAVLIPFPYAAELHQDDNAAYFAASGAATIVKDSDCTRGLFQSIVRDFLQNIPKYREAGLNAKKLAIPNAADNVLDMVDRFIPGK